MASQIESQFWMGSPFTGNLTGSIVLRNVSSTLCSVEGADNFYGVDAQGQRDTVGLGPTPPHSLARVVLPPRTPRAVIGVGLAPGDYLVIFVIGAYRDDGTDASTNGMCETANEVTPTWFVVTVGALTVRVANQNEAAGPGGPMGMPGIEGCHGAIGAGPANLSW